MNIYSNKVINQLTEDINKMTALRQQLILELEESAYSQLYNCVSSEAAVLISKALNPTTQWRSRELLNQGIYGVIKDTEQQSSVMYKASKILVVTASEGAKFTLFDQLVRTVKSKLSGLNIRRNKITFANNSSIKVITSKEDYNTADYDVIYTLPNID